MNKQVYRWCPSGMSPCEIPQNNTPRQFGRGLYFAETRESATHWLSELEEAARQRGETPNYELHEMELSDDVRLMEIRVEEISSLLCQYMREDTGDNPDIVDLWEERDFWMRHPRMEIMAQEAEKEGVLPGYSITGYILKSFSIKEGYDGIRVILPERFSIINETVLWDVEKVSTAPLPLSCPQSPPSSY